MILEITKTYAEIFEFSGNAQRFLQQNPEESKFTYALKKLSKKMNKVINDYQEKVEEFNIDNCLAADEGKGAILRDARGDYQFSKEGLKKRNAERKALFDTAVKIEPHYVEDIPDKVTLADREVFTGFVIREAEAKEDAS